MEEEEEEEKEEEEEEEPTPAPRPAPPAQRLHLRPRDLARCPAARVLCTPGQVHLSAGPRLRW